MAHLRPQLAARGVLSAAALREAPNGRSVCTAGHVIVRQRPETAKGFCFLTLEDETGTSNAILTPKSFRRFRVPLHTAAIVEIEGPLQNVDGVIHVRVRARLTRVRPAGSHVTADPALAGEPARREKGNASGRWVALASNSGRAAAQQFTAERQLGEDDPQETEGDQDGALVSACICEAGEEQERRPRAVAATHSTISRRRLGAMNETTSQSTTRRAAAPQPTAAIQLKRRPGAAPSPRARAGARARARRADPA
jgi:DNA/RNA endonuclease YhcR with UshA esterase domain